MKNRYVLFYPFVEPRIVTKDVIIKALKEQIESLENDKEVVFNVGKGLAYMCLEDTDDEGTTWYSRWTKEEFLQNLNYKEN